MNTCDHHCSRWVDAGEAIEEMAEVMENLATGGMTLYMFSSPMPQHPKFIGLRCAEDVQRLFSSHRPGGSTDLAGVIRQVFLDHFQHRQPEHILIITDGVPDSSDCVTAELVSGINQLSSPDELGLTFMQVGHDEHAASFFARTARLSNGEGCSMERGRLYYSREL